VDIPEDKFLFYFIILSGVRPSPLGIAATIVLLYQPQMIDDGDFGAVGGMRVGRGNRSTRRKLVPVPLCPPQTPHDLICSRTRTFAVGSRLLQPEQWNGLRRQVNLQAKNLILAQKGVMWPNSCTLRKTQKENM
jgi:hypothetical protein